MTKQEAKHQPKVGLAPAPLAMVSKPTKLAKGRSLASLGTLFSIWKVNQEITKIWSSYQSFGLHSYLYNSAFKTELEQRYVLTQGTAKSSMNPSGVASLAGAPENKDIQPVLLSSSSTGTAATSPICPALLLSELAPREGMEVKLEATEANFSPKWESFSSQKVDKELLHYDFKKIPLQIILDEEKSMKESSFNKIDSGKIEEEDNANLSKREKSFSFSRDYSFGEEPSEDWSFVEKRPYDSLVRENLLDVLNTLEDPIWSTRRTKRRGGRSKANLLMDSRSASVSPVNQKRGYIPLKEQLMSDDIQQVYANRLHFQQKLKWFYGLLTTSSLNRHIYPYNTKRGLRSKKLMGFGFLSELEKRLDVQLYRLGWFPTIAASRQGIQHQHITLWTAKDRRNHDFPTAPSGDIFNLRPTKPIDKIEGSRLSLDRSQEGFEMDQLRKAALNYELNKGDIVLFNKGLFRGGFAGGTETSATQGSLTRVDLLSSYWLNSKKSFNNLYRFPWELFTAFGSPKGTGPANSAIADKLNSDIQGPSNGVVWLLGNKKASLQISSSIMHKTLQSTKKGYNYLGFISHSLLKTATKNQSDLGKSTSRVGLGGLSSTLAETHSVTSCNFIGLHLSNSPLWNLSTPNHLEYHCQSFFFLYKEHPSWMSVKIPEIQNRMRNFENYMSSHI